MFFQSFLKSWCSRCLDDSGGQGIPVNNSSWEIWVPVDFSSSFHMLIFCRMNAFTFWWHKTLLCCGDKQVIIADLKKVGESRDFPTILKGRPFKRLEHRCYTAVSTVVTTYKSSSGALNSFQFTDVLLCKRIPDAMVTGLLQSWSNNGLIR